MTFWFTFSWTNAIIYTIFYTLLCYSLSVTCLFTASQLRCHQKHLPCIIKWSSPFIAKFHSQSSPSLTTIRTQWNSESKIINLRQAFGKDDPVPCNISTVKLALMRPSLLINYVMNRELQFRKAGRKPWTESKPVNIVTGTRKRHNCLSSKLFMSVHAFQFVKYIADMSRKKICVLHVLCKDYSIR